MNPISARIEHNVTGKSVTDIDDLYSDRAFDGNRSSTTRQTTGMPDLVANAA